ncbi:hypothetical protein VTH8203_01484 [Vibrio thalassae]|uniref:Uncharacterized protein n=1 Tax=Vibrio thalassae TaxID=1243014 RepID=A0A240EI59_9VIBR|nr:hypothetical protein [Vibrio thalassae]SNX47869.1 hypothetical protein VTH8203_01484 [Vibrio thalassae]
MEDKEIRFTETYSISKAGDSEELCQITFDVRNFYSTKDNLFVSEVRVEHSGHNPLIEHFKFQVFNGQVNTFHIEDFILPERLRGFRIGMFVLNKVYGLLSDEVKRAAPRVGGTLVAQDNKPNRDRMYQRLIGDDIQHPLARFDVDKNGEGYFSGVFLDVGESWKQSITAKEI